MIFLQLFYEFFSRRVCSPSAADWRPCPFLKQISLRYPWFTPNDLMDMIAVSESTPGPMGVNSATYAGFHAAGIPGAITATCSLVLPSVIIIILVSRALDKFRDSPLVKNGFLRPASGVRGSDLRRNARGVRRFPAAYGKTGQVSLARLSHQCSGDNYFPRAVARYLEAQKAASDRVYPDRRGMRHCV